MVPPAGYQQSPMIPGYMLQAHQGPNAYPMWWPYGTPSSGPSIANNEKLSHPIQEMSHGSIAQHDEMIADFRKVVGEC